MKKTHYKLHVDNPCHENWAEMTSNEQGRFCRSCRKTVIDFTCKDDHSIIAAMKKGNACGRFTELQLAHGFMLSEPARGLKMKAVSLAMLSFFMLKDISSGGSNKHETRYEKAYAPFLPGPDLEGMLTINGNALDSKSLAPVPEASVEITDGKNKIIAKAQTDTNGHFTLIVNKCDLESSYILKCYHEGYYVSFGELGNSVCDFVLEKYPTCMPSTHSGDHIVMGKMRPVKMKLVPNDKPGTKK